MHCVLAQAKHPVQVRMPHVPSTAAPAMTSASMRAPTPSSAQHSSHTSQVTVAPSPAPFVPSPAMHPSPSPQVSLLSLGSFMRAFMSPVHRTFSGSFWSHMSGFFFVHVTAEKVAPLCLSHEGFSDIVGGLIDYFIVYVMQACTEITSNPKYTCLCTCNFMIPAKLTAEDFWETGLRTKQSWWPTYEVFGLN